MARKINRLNARAVSTLTKHGRHADGGGLYLSISPMAADVGSFCSVGTGNPPRSGLAPRAMSRWPALAS
jgi:hypothetical protein